MAGFWQAGGDTSGMITTFLPLVFAFLLFYLLLIRPQQTRQKKWNAMVETLKSGDRVTTSGGMRGIITRVKDDSFVLRVPPDNLQLEVVKTSIVSVTTEDEKK
jgi:preprotein translocase subunit YajC